MRSPQEIAFRLKQESRNVLLRLFPSSLPERTDVRGPLPFLPAPEPVFQRLAETPFAQECERLAEGILHRRFPIFGMEICTEPRIRWRCDYLSGIETPPVYFRRIPYLDASRVGDHKIIWELNRHQHLVPLAQAYRFTGRKEFLEDIPRQLETWFEDNPFQCGINWVSALEVAFRALSWIWVLHFAGADFEPAFRFRFLTWLYRHGEHLAGNLSVYFSPNTHLLGEAVALHALGLVFSRNEWAETGSRIVREEILRQVHDDGSHFEQSSYYHLYALDMFLFEAVLSKPRPSYTERLTAMARFLDCLTSDGQLPFLGDDDGGRLFHPYGARNRFGAATLASCGVLLDRPAWIRDASDLAAQAAWWFGQSVLGESALNRQPASDAPRDSAHFSDSGLVVMTSGSFRILCDAGPFGPGSAGHSHSDTLSIVASDGGEALLIDPGTYTYVGDPAWRNRFRGSAAHNTVRIDGRDQADPAGPFSWKNPPQVKTVRWRSYAEYDLLISLCNAYGVTHKRSILMLKEKSASIIIDDIFEDGQFETKERLIEQFWHPGPLADRLSPRSFAVGSRATLTLCGDCDRSEGGEFGWRSPAPGRKSEAILLRLSRKGRLPVRLASVLDFRGDRVPGSLEPAGEYLWIYDGSRRITFDFEKR